MSAAIEAAPIGAEQIHLFKLPVGGSANSVQLKLPRKLKYEEWERVTIDLIITEGSTQWLVGDSLLYGREAFGEMWAQVIDVEKLKRTDESTIRGYLWVSENVPPVLRRTNLRWYHHKEVAKLSHREQAAWLERAETLGWTVRELRANIRSVADDADQEQEAASELEVLQDPAVRQFLEEHKEALKARREAVPAGVPSVLNMIDAQIGHTQWQLDRTPGEEAARVMDAIDEGWQIGAEIFNWLQKRSYFMRESELRERLAWMCDENTKKLREVKQGGKKDNQRGDLTSMYVKYDSRTGDAYIDPRANSIYSQGEAD